MKTSIGYLLGLSLLGAGVAQAVTYAIDIDSTRLSGGDTSGVIDTAPGFASLDATNGGSAAVEVNGINFQLFTVGGNASRLRPASSTGAGGTATALTRDFVFEDGGSAAVGILIGGAGDLPVGIYRVEVWAWDADPNSISPVIVASRRNNAETIHTESFGSHATDPFVFELESDGVSAYDIFVRENSDSNRARLNAVRITTIPEPSSLVLGLGALLGALGVRRRQG
ncbi:PEP-CTERM sorting domain-containing protein [Roseibacillus ishigakijimensis]|uniref:PEP-CTERM sorting domain-containing protein n=1 Tax=Roseibacillus ishigakijimensis TaxID=454146 RepID=A0A934RQ94_9BACT|nr:PEP-CTERM sorting domain-containing protein [Roseibacillus ishigakijimensis]MBK1833109.1 PEP-CTERM sorting domain-containing protein [Roseibacillus ishigakijimensis]